MIEQYRPLSSLDCFADDSNDPDAGFLPCGDVLIIIPSAVRATLRSATLLSLSLTAVPLLNTICPISWFLIRDLMNLAALGWLRAYVASAPSSPVTLPCSSRLKPD
jgi:hypothetical protein